MTKIYLVPLFVLFWISQGLKPINSHQIVPANPFGGAISVQGTKFVDSYGRQVIFSGLNYVDKDPNENYLLADSAKVYRQFNKWGVNCLRMGLIWDGAEPEPGVFNDKYLDAIEKKVQWANSHFIYVMLDMHQDLYGRKFGDGAPVWATLDDGQPHQTGDIWSDAYLMSGAVQRSFDNFWANKPASDGTGIQDHYISLWKHIAKRFSKYKNILGYDIMNEPFNGSDANSVMPLILSEYAKMLVEETGQAPPKEQDLMAMWANEKSRLEVLKKISKGDQYARIIDAAFAPNRQFETGKLQPFYQLVTDAIRQVDTTHIIFLEHGYFSNPGIRTSIEPVKAKNGQPDRLQAYGAHAYDLIVDTKDGDQQSNDRVELIIDRIQETSTRMNVPVLVGEWGAFYGMGASYIPPARFILSMFERYHFGNTYWAYRGTMGSTPCFNEALLRPYPQFTAGALKEYLINYETGLFSCTWTENGKVKAPTVIFIPDLTTLEKSSIRLTPQNENTIIQPIPNSKAGYLIVPIDFKGGKRKLNFSLIKIQPVK